ncbi:dehydrogenase/reductase SDR family member on chromosome X [Perognathus longimembris pacificus]|uniref:dehydrogenase/reductase SDR family member on chromosome X n=1 Tax=Perognathus longimembris pacificus TaxID=214514 RepID=UPI002019A131|nr:dehydrogenase/reductase SDR family member on chromosome X [Perognathus longimembris pacificus]
MASQLLRRCRGGFREPALPPQPGRVALVTGGTEGIGLATARQLARLRMRVLLAGNDAARGEAAAQALREQTLNDQVEFLYLDLASQHSVRRFARDFRARGTRLDVLVNNAGVMMVPRRTTPDGLEEHFGLNYLGHFLLTRLLLGPLRASGRPGRAARVVTVASATHRLGYVRLDDLQGRLGYSAHAAYAQSKLALVLFTYRLQRLLEAEGGAVTANAVDPGVVDTALFRHVWWGPRLAQRLLGRWAFKTPDEGAWTSVVAAASPALEGVGGRYLRDEAEAASHPLTYDPALQRRLWDASCRLAGLPEALAP